MIFPFRPALEACRKLDGPLASPPDVPYGAFLLRPAPNTILVCVADSGERTGWEHVSAHTQELQKRKGNRRWVQRTPTWDEMCLVKDAFWDAEECVVQFHPPASEYVNNCAYSLHMWRHRTEPMPRPPSKLVGILLPDGDAAS